MASETRVVSLSMVVLSIGMGPMPAIVDLWGYVQNSSSFVRHHNSKTKQYQNLKFCGCVGIHDHKRQVIVKQRLQVKK